MSPPTHYDIINGTTYDLNGIHPTYPPPPSPFNPSTNLEFKVAERVPVRLIVYDILGREVATLVNEVKSPGTYTARFDGSLFASGVYLYRLSAGAFSQVKKCFC